ncbi:FAD-dependent monooxygenase [Dendronalium sp. ChiSLP03b]|uniref:FAD-dependent monooxygenase n=1 Tax=Dendronalium sp. ChiSLP03b TaxID=3075381 RepID=UPI002AD3E688|nr:FAD-dependent monooxygenase [Dendronalium sp. ChiSLP03b]MDZ8203058.1 FAD-dependent monooxygenase [Dendronalium sp. ChiSLP03b]
MLKKVAIIGGGLGGLAVAIALHKQGINAQVYEKARFLHSVGAGLSIVPNGLNSLEAIAPGITESLKGAGSQTQMLTLKKSTGEMIAQKAVTLMEKYGQPMLLIRWSRLQEILASALPPETIHLDRRCIGFEQNDKGVEVYFDGRDKVQADLLIGADGLNSAVRQTMIGDGEPCYAGRMSWRAVLKYSHEMLPANEVMSMTAPDGKIFGFFDLGSGYMFWAATSLWPDESIIHTGDAKSRVQEKFLNWAQPVQAILKATNAEDIVERPICDRPPLQNWSQGRVTLLGDAAHPMVPLLGQGANTAFEDAWELSQHLCHAPSITDALVSYENSRKPRTQIIQIRNAVQANRSYKADSETYLRGMLEKAQVSDREFEEWLYNYKPSVAAYT